MSEPGAVPRLHVVTDDEVLARPEWSAAASAVLLACGTSIAMHVRGPRTSGRKVFNLTRDLLEDARLSGAMVIVNDRVDVAIAAKAHGAHVGRRSLPPALARAELPGTSRLGVSCRSVEEITTAIAGGADYVFAGTVFPTASHPGDPGIGVDGLQEMAEVDTQTRVLAIGGVSVERVDHLMAAGAYGVAVVSGVWSAVDPAGSALRYVEALSASLVATPRRHA